MDATEICALSPESVAQLLTGRQRAGRGSAWHGRRNAQRWSFPGTIELWIPEAGSERHALASSINLSTTGVGLRCDEPLTPGMELGIAIHEPEMSFHGRAVVRHCTETPDETCIVGLQFLFP